MTTQAIPQSDTKQSPLSKEEVNQWAQDEIVKLHKFCMSLGINFKKFDQSKCLHIPPLIGIWYINSAEKGKDYWAISGEFPTDVIASKVAKNAREAVRHIALNWQLKAARIEESIADGRITGGDKETQQKIVEDLIQKAETLYAIHNDDKLWSEAGL